MKKRGQELSTNTIIIVVLAVLVLIVVAVFFTGGFTTFVNKFKGIWSHSALDVSEIVLECNSYCTNFENTEYKGYRDKFCEADKFNLDIDGDKKTDETVGCMDLPQVSCQAIEEAGGCF